MLHAAVGPSSQTSMAIAEDASRTATVTAPLPCCAALSISTSSICAASAGDTAADRVVPAVLTTRRGRFSCASRGVGNNRTTSTVSAFSFLNVGVPGCPDGHQRTCRGRASGTASAGAGLSRRVRLRSAEREWALASARAQGVSIAFWPARSDCRRRGFISYSPMLISMCWRARSASCGRWAGPLPKTRMPGRMSSWVDGSWSPIGSMMRWTGCVRSPAGWYSSMRAGIRRRSICARARTGPIRGRYRQPHPSRRGARPDRGRHRRAGPRPAGPGSGGGGGTARTPTRAAPPPGRAGPGLRHVLPGQTDVHRRQTPTRTRVGCLAG